MSSLPFIIFWVSVPAITKHFVQFLITLVQWQHSTNMILIHIIQKYCLERQVASNHHRALPFMMLQTLSAFSPEIYGVTRALFSPHLCDSLGTPHLALPRNWQWYTINPCFRKWVQACGAWCWIHWKSTANHLRELSKLMRLVTIFFFSQFFYHFMQF